MHLGVCRPDKLREIGYKQELPMIDDSPSLVFTLLSLSEAKKYSEPTHLVTYFLDFDNSIIFNGHTPRSDKVFITIFSSFI